MRQPGDSRAWSVRFFLALFILVWPLRLACALNDEIVLADRVEKGQVVKDALDGVSLKIGTGTTTLKPEQVKFIRFDVAHADFDTAMSAFERGQYDVAAKLLKGLAMDENLLASMREVVRPALFYVLGESLYRLGTPADARAARAHFETILTQYASSRYMPEAVDRLLDLYIRESNFVEAEKMLDKFEGLGGEYKIKSLFYRADIALLKREPAKAVRLFRDAASQTRMPETRALAKLGQARCAVAQKDFKTARELADEALQGNPPRTVLAAAYLIVGNALIEEAASEKGDAAKEKYLDAVLELLRISTLAPNSAYEAEALYLAGEISLLRLAKLSGRGAADRNRGQELLGEVAARYGSSSWGGKARSLLEQR